MDLNLINSVILKFCYIQINSNHLLGSWAAHLAVCRRNAVCKFGWGLIVRGLLLLSVARNTLTALPF